MNSFQPAKMCSLILSLTVFLLAIPVGLLVAALVVSAAFALPAVFMIGIYAWIWLRLRPSRFVVTDDALEVHWPLKRVDIPIHEITDVSYIDRKQLNEEIGWGVRVGAGGIWGGFGWLWTQRRGIVQMYITRIDTYVWIERGSRRPWLITPERPDEFVRALLGATKLD